MTQSNPENPIEETPVEAPVQPQPSPGLDSRRRLRELLSVPERDRTDEVWDEIIELEIQLAPGNRVSGNEHAGGQGRGPQQGKPQGGGGGGAGGQQKKHRPRANNNRRGRPGKPPAGGGGNPA